jgi:MoxR-like ATPase
LAKTFSVSTLSKVLDLDFKRIQFTPDLLPSDLIGSKIYDVSKKDFSIKK